MSLFTVDKETAKGQILNELQGLTISLVGGETTPAKHDLAAIRDTDTVVKALNNNAGTITDVTSTISLVSLKATGTITGTNAIATDVVTVNGQAYTFQAAAPTALGQVQIGADDDADMVNLAAAINAFETAYGEGLGEVSPGVIATSASNVVTLTAPEEGTAGNAIAVVSSDGTLVSSGATLAGGTATGGFTSTGTTNQVILFWFNKS